MKRLLILLLWCWCGLHSLAWADDDMPVKQTHVHIEKGVVYCDVQSFQQEAYVLNVLGSGSSLTVFWQFVVVRPRSFWPDQTIAKVRLGRQVIPDLVTQRWLMRDLSSGVVHDTRNVREAMRFLTEMQHAAVVDTSILDTGTSYRLEVRLYLHEGEQAEESWFSGLLNWGVDMGSVVFDLPAPPHAEKGSALE